MLFLLIESSLLFAAEAARKGATKSQYSKLGQLRTNSSLDRRKVSFWNAQLPVTSKAVADAPAVSEPNCIPIISFKPEIDAVKVFPTLGFNVRLIFSQILGAEYAKIFQNYCTN